MMAGLRLLSSGCYATGRLLQELRIITCASYRTIYRKKGGHDVMHEGEFGRSREEQLRLAEEAEDLFNKEGWQYVPNRLKDDERRQKQIKFKIIEKKYFKDPQETNLLTWDAKEQMRYLHQEFPEEWTLDRLAESFPISREGVIKVLNSQWRPRSLKEVLRHDRAVRKHWLALSAGEKDSVGGGGPLEERYQKLLDSGKLCNAAGIETLPSPKARLKLPQSEDMPQIATSVIPFIDDGHKIHPQRKRFVDIVAGRLQQKEATGANEVSKKSKDVGDYYKQNLEVLDKVIQGLPKRKDRPKKDLSIQIEKSQGPSEFGWENKDIRHWRKYGKLKELQDGTGREDFVSLFNSFRAEVPSSGKGSQDEKDFLAQAQATLDGEMEIPEVNNYQEIPDKDSHIDHDQYRQNDAVHSSRFGSAPLMPKTVEEKQDLKHQRNHRSYPPEWIDTSDESAASKYAPSDWNRIALEDPLDDPLEIKRPRRTLRGRRSRIAANSERDLVSQGTTQPPRHLDYSMANYEQLQMEGTGKVSSKGEELNQYEYETEEDVIASTAGRAKKYSHDPAKDKVLHDLRFDVPQSIKRRDGGYQEEEAYLYSPTSGYQHPFGKEDPDLKIAIPKEHKSDTSRRYQKGNAVYDENGDLLYKIPG